MLKKKKILVTGSNGLLGQNLISLFVNETDFEVFAFSKGENRISKTTNFTYYNIDLTNAEVVRKHLKKIQPNYIINGAALTNVDVCENDKNLCDTLNVIAVQTLIDYCEKSKTHLIQISTDFIFDGKKGLYTEDDKPNPINYYGESKLKSELLLQNSTIDFTILRTILVYGKVENANKGNIVLWVKSELEKGKKINVINDQFRMPILANDLAKACLLVIQNSKISNKQIYHISSNELLSIYEIAIQVAEVFNLDKSLINQITTEELNQKAQRPPKTGFVLDKAVAELGFESVSFKERLLYFKEMLAI